MAGYGTWWIIYKIVFPLIIGIFIPSNISAIISFSLYILGAFIAFSFVIGFHLIRLILETIYEMVFPPILKSTKSGQYTEQNNSQSSEETESKDYKNLHSLLGVNERLCGMVH